MCNYVHPNVCMCIPKTVGIGGGKSLDHDSSFERIAGRLNRIGGVPSSESTEVNLAIKLAEKKNEQGG